MRSYYTWKTGNLREVKGDVVREQPLTVFVNGQKLITLLSSPTKLDCLVVGYLWLEKVITGVEEIRRLQVSEVDGRAEIELTRDVELPKERILTSGCGGGITFRIDPRLFPRVESRLRVHPVRLFERMKDLYLGAAGYRSSRGIHGAALADPERLLFLAEDVGRHNAVDKVVGEALLAGVSTRDRILLNTGRVSSEMLLKGVRLGAPLVVSRTSPTEMAIGLAEQLGVTVVGYLRHDAFNLYAGGDHLDLEGASQG
jgi:FdhD protein